MNVQRRDFVLLAIVAAAAAAPALGQDAAPAVGPANSGAQSAASVPDFSGIWGHPSIPGFEPPTSGHGPVTNRSRRQGVSDGYQSVGDYTNPILKPQAAEIVKKHGEIELTGVAYPTPTNQCWPEGVPHIFMNVGMQMLQQPDKITMLYSYDHQVRHVRMNRPHPPQVTPTFGEFTGNRGGATQPLGASVRDLV